MSRRLLARSEHFTVSHEFERVMLTGRGREVIIGDFCGDPQAAVIDWHERWCVTVGCGLIVYFLRDPFAAYEYDRQTDQWSELHRGPDDAWHIEAVYQASEDTVRFVADPVAPESGVYELRIPDMALAKLI